MTNFKTLLASVSAAAILATPLAAQVAQDGNQRVGTAQEETMQMDQDTVNRVESTEVAPDTAPLTGNERVGVAQEMDDQTPATDSPMTIGTAESLKAEIADSTLNPANAYVGNWVKSSDGAELGQITGVYENPNGTQTAVVALDDTLGLDTDEFLVNMSAQASVDDSITLAQTKLQFMNEVAEIVGTTPVAEKM
ncbi:hypothetical protein GLS40_03690 [Pseudooceanicola sp. 216_PA32_1]|uniref:PRC-barrel domain-containing protein n=1 Tax=Pseudooceanicola pacificus TaxID=2676438 RepID=A0A844WDZ9_9RHOB|nr:hypothetical protein [Pseudooceanicola pacificus]MWB77119.1 hypothetical protein [Pseudooceanicola pacificus]